MRKNILFLALAFLLLLNCTVEASLFLSSGGKTFNINVVRRDYRPIYDARGSVFISGNTARIEVRATGYRTGRCTIYLRENVNSYRETVSLDDPTMFVDIYDDSHAYIQDGYCNYYSQSLYQTDEFGIRGRFPVKGFEKITSRDFDIRVNSMFAWLPRIYLNKSGDFWNFEVIVRRRDFSDFSNRIQILVKRTPDETPASAELLASLADDYQHNQMLAQKQADEVYFNRLTSLAREINRFYFDLSEDEKASLLKKLETAPQLLRELSSREKFREIHH